MAKFKIEWIETKTSAKGTLYARATLKDEQGTSKTDVAIFSTFPGFKELQPGSEIEGLIRESDYNGKKSYSIESEAKSGGGFGKNTERLMEKKATQIGEAQHRKELSIAAAQDRAAWMWAKYSACELIAHSGKDWTEDAINNLATRIYNMEPTEPF